MFYIPDSTFIKDDDILVSVEDNLEDIVGMSRSRFRVKLNMEKRSALVN
ncbi:MAG: hypothetical protein ACLS54_10530 [Anaerostipes hadrus]